MRTLEVSVGVIFAGAIALLGAALGARAEVALPAFSWSLARLMVFRSAFQRELL